MGDNENTTKTKTMTTITYTISKDDESVAKTTCCLKKWKSSYSKHGVGSQV